MEKINAGYRSYTGHIFTQAEAKAYKAACDRVLRHPTEENRNGAHNLFRSIVELGRTSQS